MKREKSLGPKDAKRYLAIARVVGPAVAPFVMRGATAVRAGYDRWRARQLGVPVDDLGTFSGKGAALHARVAGDREALSRLRSRDDAEIQTFTENAGHRLEQLSTVVRAAERMPARRRRSAHRAVAGELVQVEEALFEYLGIRGR